MTILAIVYGKAKRCLKENLVDFADYGGLYVNIQRKEGVCFGEGGGGDG